MPFNKETFNNAKETFIKVFSKNPNITKADYQKSAALLVVIFVIIFVIFFPLQESPTFGKHIKEFDQLCLVNCETDKCKSYTKATRGNTYNITGSYDSFESCVFNIWEFSHIFMHIFIGYWLDIRYSLGIGIVFETYEWVAYGCENYADILWNTVGCVIGSYIRIKTVKPTK